MRPRSDIRMTVLDAAQKLVAEGSVSGATWRDLARYAQIEPPILAAKPVRNMAACGELRSVGQTKVPGVCRPMVLYMPAQRSDSAQALASVLNSWARFK